MLLTASFVRFEACIERVCAYFKLICVVESKTQYIKSYNMFMSFN